MNKKTIATAFAILAAFLIGEQMPQLFYIVLVMMLMIGTILIVKDTLNVK